MRWIRIGIDCKAAATEPASAALFEAGCGGTEEDARGVAGYLPVDDSLEGRLATLRDRLDRIPRDLQPHAPEIVLTFAEEEDWANAWKAHFHPTPIGRRLVIAPSWSDYSPRPEQVVVELDPGMAFGTGAHPTTQLCLLALDERIAGGETVVDWGTGSGILAVAAARLGARRVVAADVDPLAGAIARANVARNGVEGRVDVLVADDPACLRIRADLVVCNTLAGILIDLAPALAALVRPGGALIASGIVDSRADEVERRIAECGFRLEEVRRDAEWVALFLERVDDGR